MDSFVTGLIVGMVVALVGRTLFQAWLWTRERNRVSRAAEVLRRNGRHLRVARPGIERPFEAQPNRRWNRSTRMG